MPGDVPDGLDEEPDGLVERFGALLGAWPGLPPVEDPWDAVLPLEAP